MLLHKTTRLNQHKRKRCNQEHLDDLPRNRPNSQWYPNINEDWVPKVVEDIEKSDKYVGPVNIRIPAGKGTPPTKE